jgi:hypothetical protein
MLPANRLLELGRDFAQDLTDRVARVIDLPDGGFSALATGSGSRGRVSVAILGEDMVEREIPLVIQGQARLRLRVKFQCCWDTGGDYLTVDRSFFHVRPGDRGLDEPLFRYDYVRSATAAVPAAHLQLHAHRDEFVHLLLMGNKHNRQARADKQKYARLAEFHFPLGGHRFRPCLEDVFEALVNEFGIEVKEGWRAAIHEGREQWRRTQLLASVRDAPRDAARALTDLGWTVTPPAQPPGDKVERLRAF